MPASREQSRKEEILDAAIEIMLERGHAHLSMDKVAKTLGISKGNITYHFPTKKIFVQSIFKRLLVEAQEARQIRADPYIVSLEERLKRKIEREFEILLASRYDTRAWETLAYSTQDEIVGEAFEELFGWLVDDMVEAVAPLRPDLSKQELHDLALFLVSIPRGLLVFVGSARTCPRRKELVALGIDRMMDLIKTWPRAQRD